MTVTESDDPRDIDSDGDGFTPNEGDCDDSDDTVYPGAPELCDGKDNNCNGEVDEGVQTAFYIDADGDGYGAAGSAPIYGCSAPIEGYVDNNLDCDDTDVSVFQNCEEDPCANPIEILSINGPLDPRSINSSISVSAAVSGRVASAVWFWDDGSSTEISMPSTNYEASHMYTTPGIYQIKLVLLDECGNEWVGLPDLAVIYDPNGGFITGGGWIWSPKGAHQVDQEAEGRANFGFVAKYRKGSNKVDGNTEFQFRNGNLNFHSSSHNDMSLVIAGHKGIYKGLGRVNGQEGYSFMVSAVDGDLKDPKESDKFRIKIWQTANGAILYDNQLGSADNADAITPISGGSIVIHQPAKGKNKSIDANGLTIVPWNTPFEEIKDYELLITNEFGQEVNLKVNWSEAGYDPLVSGMYTISGSLMESISFKLQHEVQMYVLVEEKALPIDIEIDNNIIPKSIVDGGVIGTLRTIDPSDDIHAYAMMENEFVELDGDRVLWKGAQFLKNEMRLTIWSTDRVGQAIEREITLNREVISNQIIIYPNPATSETNIRVDIFKPSVVAIRLYDAKGVLILETQEEHSETFIKNLNLNGIANGMYQVQVQIDHQIITKILIKNN